MENRKYLVLAQWNINSIRARLDRVINFIDRHQVDVLCLQEIKCTQDQFPEAPFLERGFTLSCLGQKARHGVATLSKFPLKVNPVDFFDGEARFLWNVVLDWNIINIYAPNGSSIGSKFYEKKLEWFEKCYTLLADNKVDSGKSVILGDFNVAPTDDDVFDSTQWGNDILCSQKERQALEKIVSLGFIDQIDKIVKEQPPRIFTWWDYRGLAFPLNLGARIDLLLATKKAQAAILKGFIVRDERKGIRPSDHAPIIWHLRT